MKIITQYWNKVIMANIEPDLLIGRKYNAEITLMSIDRKRASEMKTAIKEPISSIAVGMPKSYYRISWQCKSRAIALDEVS